MKNERFSRIILRSLKFTFMLSLALFSLVWADVPPPPVNQLIGLYDSLYEDLGAADCRVCHDAGVADRHHLLMNTLIPDPTSAPYGTPGNLYECLSCHAQDVSSGFIVFLIEDNCIACHTNDPQSRPSRPHHVLQDALDRHCSVCHGSVVQDYDDEHYIPDYDISTVTPDPACKTWDGPICVSGGCEVCHTADATAVPPIASTRSLHHSAGFNCTFCHQMHGNIRDCEACHSPDSLHNIQADSDNPANLGIIIPGEENLGWGHIGNGWDCFGCHESFNGASAFGGSGFSTASVTPQTGSIIPSVSGMSVSSVTAGNDTVLNVSGSSFINESSAGTLNSEIFLDHAGSGVTLQTESITVNSISGIVPSTVPAGLYTLRVIKGDKKSNKRVLAVVPAVSIIDVSCSRKKGVLTVTGTGFGEKPAGSDDYISVQIDGQQANITFWSDTRINATVSGCSNNAVITVNALMGSASTGDSSNGGKPPKPCKGKHCND